MEKKIESFLVAIGIVTKDREVGVGLLLILAL